MLNSKEKSRIKSISKVHPIFTSCSQIFAAIGIRSVFKYNPSPNVLGNWRISIPRGFRGGHICVRPAPIAFVTFIFIYTTHFRHLIFQFGFFISCSK